MESITRQELYRRVWSEPITKIAPRYGLSDRGMGKLCARYDIPVPPRGYWARKAAGKRVSQALLPSPEKEVTIWFELPRKQPSEPTVQQPLAPEIEFERDPVNFIMVEPNARLTHPLVLAASSALKGQEGDRDGIVRRIGCVDLRVSRQMLGRALRIMQALIRALEQRGWTVVVRERDTQTTVLGETITFFLRERLKQKIRDLTHDERRWRREGHEIRPYVLEATGELVLHLGSSYGRSPAGDGKNQRLEDCLNRFTEALVHDALRQKEIRAEHKRYEQRRQEAERRRHERRMQRIQEEARFERFDRLVEYWNRAQQRRAFLEQLRAAIGPVDAASDLGQWLAWTQKCVALSDPLERFRQRGPSVRVYFGGYDHEIRQIRERGFEDPIAADADRDKATPGILLQDRKPAVDWAKEMIEMELSEELLLPYETTEPGFIPRMFCVPARVLNECLERSKRSQPSTHDSTSRDS